MRLSARHARPPLPILPGLLVMPGPDRASLSYRASSSVIPSEASVSPASCDTLGLRPQYDSPSTTTFWPDIAPLAGRKVRQCYVLPRKCARGGPLTYAGQLPAPRSIRRFPRGANLLNISCLSKLTYSETDKSIPITHSVSITYLHARMYRPWRRFLDSLRSLGMTRECARNGLAPQNAGW